MYKYREGKVKKTNEQFLKPSANKLLELRTEWQRTFCIMGQQLYLYSKLKLLSVGVAKASLKKASMSYMNNTRNEVI